MSDKEVVQRAGALEELQVQERRIRQQPGLVVDHAEEHVVVSGHVLPPHAVAGEPVLQRLQRRAVGRHADDEPRLGGVILAVLEFDDVGVAHRVFQKVQQGVLRLQIRMRRWCRPAPPT